MELYSEYGWLLIYFETEGRGGSSFNYGAYTIVDAGGMYAGASGGGGLEIITDYVTFSDPRSPWYFLFGPQPF